jgi:hypothetical protein
MSALLLTAAVAVASFAPPEFTPEQTKQLEKGMPTDRFASVIVDVQVDPKGRTSQCKTIAFSGDRELLSGLCARVEQVSIQPATVLQRPAYGVARQRLTLTAGVGGEAVAMPADIEVEVNVLPGGGKSLLVTANVLVDPAGKPQACYAPDAPAGYGDVACGQVSGITFGQLDDKDGKPVQYVRTVAVDFVKSAG